MCSLLDYIINIFSLKHSFMNSRLSVEHFAVFVNNFDTADVHMGNE